MLPRNPTALLLSRLSAPARELVQAICDASPVPVYAVGGVVRDLALDRPVGDIDLTVETDPVGLAEAANQAVTLPARLRRHHRFGTVSLEEGSTRVDIAMSRAERYATAAALPEVLPARIADDLLRRDFTINAIAFDLGDRTGYVDPADGAADIEQGIVRALHPRSFIDDPTRLFRACRYAGRLAFDIEPSTRTWMSEGLGYVDRLSPARLRNELFAILHEAAPAAALDCAQHTNVLPTALPRLAALSPSCIASLDNLPGFTGGLDPLTVRLCILGAGLGPAAIREVVTRLALPRSVEAAVAALPAAGIAVRPFERPVARVSEFVRVCERFPAPTLAALAVATESPALRVAIESFLTAWHRFRPAVRAEELMAAGYTGPLLGAVLDRLRAARLDGDIDASGELAWVEREFGSRREADSL